MTLSRKIILKKALAAACAMTALAAGTAMAEPVSVFTYHNHPPFITEGGKGLTYEFVDYLNKKSKGNPAFKIEVLSRAQIDKVVAAPEFSGAVAWVAPAWFRDKDKTVYLWSNSVMEDANVILSGASQKLDYKDPSSLKGKQFGGMAGHKYAGIDELVASGDIKREDVDKERSNLRKLEAGRIDATLLPRSTANFLLNEMELTSKLYVAPTPHSSYTRHVLISKKNPELQKLINDALSEMAKDSAWQATLAKYKAK